MHQENYASLAFPTKEFFPTFNSISNLQSVAGDEASGRLIDAI
jgi:hypothetical protein